MACHETQALPSGPILVTAYTKTPPARQRKQRHSQGLISLLGTLFKSPSSPQSHDAKTTTPDLRCNELPPVQAFSFKGLLATALDMPTSTKITHADLPPSSGAHDNIKTSLMRIAEICARSRYSLSNQHEAQRDPNRGTCYQFAQVQSIEPAYALQVADLHASPSGMNTHGSSRSQDQTASLQSDSST